MAGRLDAPSAVEQESTGGQGPDLLARRRLGHQQRRQTQEKNQENRSHSVYFCAIGKRRPIPNALVVTFSPGAACCRLYSLRSTFLMMFRTRSRGKSCSLAMRSGAWFSSI